MLNYYEDIESIKVNLSVDESEVFSYASTSNATGRNPLESAVAFCELLRRDCVDAQGREAVGNLCGAKPICVDENANGVVYKNNFGKGKIYFVAFKDYVESENDTLVLSHLMKLIGREGDIYCDNKNLSFTVRETDDEYRISVLNMNCLENADESFNITFKGYNLSSSVKVGEIKDFVLKK